jgi:ligand-binding sensor domain-containing protein
MPAGARALAVAPDFAGTIWAPNGHGAFRSPDGGHSWQRVRDSTGAMSVAFSESHAYVIVPGGARIGDYGGKALAQGLPTPAPFVSVSSPYHRTNRFYALDADGGLWLSINQGRRWQRLRAQGLPPNGVTVSSVRDLITMPDIVYVCTTQGLYRSLDDGASFQAVGGIADPRMAAMTTDDQDLVLVAAGDGLYRSVDRGAHFSKVSDAVATAVAFDPRNHRLAYAAVGDRLLRSTDAGATWDE